MKRSIALLLLVCFVSACVPAPEQYTVLEPRLTDVKDVQSILIQIDYGEVILLPWDDSRVSIGGEVLFVDELEYQVESDEKKISVKVFSHRDSPSSAPLKVVIHLPKDKQVKVETDNASVLAQGYQGDMEVASISGDIDVEQMNGKLTLRSNRGSITVDDSSGVVSVVGNYGALTLRNVNGEIAASTIMGDIMFDGLIQGGDVVRLETDHGAVAVNLNADSALNLQARSTSGEVTCLLPGITSTTRTCDGEIHSAQGSLSIRTVSGAVTLQLMP
ncbi:MAG: DUF4097 domain-containing protein [Anaerolineae bacterium]|nr:DUF4097 domain-containing protein [Anaerolineae bacterium]